jgi:hypothetical protein
MTAWNVRSRQINRFLKSSGGRDKLSLGSKIIDKTLTADLKNSMVAYSTDAGRGVMACHGWTWRHVMDHGTDQARRHDRLR